MPYSRERLSSSWIVLWVLCFFGGMIVVFSFLLGNPFYSGLITGKYSVSSDEGSALFVNGEFFSQTKIEGNIEVGQKDWCVEKFFLVSRCFSWEVLSNEFPVLDHENVFLFARSFLSEVVTDKKVYFDPLGNGLFWIDEDLSLVFGVRSGEGFFLERLYPLDSLEKDDKDDKDDGHGIEKDIKKNVDYDSQKKEFYIHLDSKKELILNFPEAFLVFSHIDEVLSGKDSPFEIEKSAFLQKRKGKEDRLFASFDVSAQKISPFGGVEILEFPTSVWIFDFSSESFQKITTKDLHSQVFFYKKTSSLFFQKNGVLYHLFLKKNDYKTIKYKKDKKNEIKMKQK